MIELNINLKLCKYDELTETAKENAFNNHEMFLRENPSTYETEDENGNMVEKYDDMDTWDFEVIKEYVEDNIRMNEYLFLENGVMANCTTYTGKHENAGKTVLHFLGKDYEVEE